MMLENVRFHSGETENDPEFARALAEASCADVFVNDAFGTAHRAHASTAGVTTHSSERLSERARRCKRLTEREAKSACAELTLPLACEALPLHLTACILQQMVHSNSCMSDRLLPT